MTCWDFYLSKEGLSHSEVERPQMEKVEVRTELEFILRQVKMDAYQIKDIVECTNLEIGQKGLKHLGKSRKIKTQCGQLQQ